MKRILITLGFALCLPAQADVLQVPEQGGEPATMDRSMLPRTGTSMEGVNQRYGEPLSISGPVGDPPITRWTYSDFVVFFEYNLVISSVIPGKPAPIYHQDELRRGDG